MSKEKQIIEQMAKVITEANDNNHCWNIACNNCKYWAVDADMCQNCFAAEALYNAGFRKQSEWISVDERLPEEGGKYLVYRKNYLYDHTDIINYDGCIWYYLDDEWGCCELSDITHWMPLPEAPKGGGE